jgi:hypothetical protein
LQVERFVNSLVVLGEGGSMVCAGQPSEVAVIVEEVNNGSLSDGASGADALRYLLGEQADDVTEALLVGDVNDADTTALLQSDTDVDVEMTSLSAPSVSATRSELRERQRKVHERWRERTEEQHSSEPQRMMQDSQGPVDIVQAAEDSLTGRTRVGNKRGRVEALRKEVAPLVQVCAHVSAITEVPLALSIVVLLHSAEE